ncbi:hypothetical protein B0H14DRAFT_2878088, partial [Mycena olivaceomarginata]
LHLLGFTNASLIGIVRMTRCTNVGNGRHLIAYFEGNIIASKGAGCIMASGRQLNDTGICEL